MSRLFRLEFHKRILNQLAKETKPILRVLEIIQQRRQVMSHLLLSAPLDNNYNDVHVKASERKQRISRNWYQNVFKLLDDDDVLTFNGALRGHVQIKRTAGGIFQSQWNRKTKLRFIDNKPVQFEPAYGSDVERDAIVSIIEQSLRNFERYELTHTQVETIILERHAKEHNAPAVDKHIASVLNISRRGARKRLTSARKAKKYLSDNVIDIIDIERRVRKQLPRLCAWCSEPTRDGSYAFCMNHHKQFLVDGNFEDVLIKDDAFWRLKNKSDAEHSQRVIEFIRNNAA